jgi:hypothetical protein
METTDNKKSNYKKLIEINAYSFITFHDLPDFIQKEWRVKFSRIPYPDEEILDEGEIRHLLSNWSIEGTPKQAHTNEHNVVQDWDKTYYSVNDPNTSFDFDSEDFDKAIWQMLNTNLYYENFDEGKRWIEYKYLEVETEELEDLNQEAEFDKQHIEVLKKNLKPSLADS